MYKSVNANFDDMGCTWKKLCKTRLVKRNSKLCAHLIVKKLLIRKIAELLFHSIDDIGEHAWELLLVNEALPKSIACFSKT